MEIEHSSQNQEDVEDDHHLHPSNAEENEPIYVTPVDAPYPARRKIKSTTTRRRSLFEPTQSMIAARQEYEKSKTEIKPSDDPFWEKRRAQGQGKGFNGTTSERKRNSFSHSVNGNKHDGNDGEDDKALHNPYLLLAVPTISSESRLLKPTTASRRGSYSKTKEDKSKKISTISSQSHLLTPTAAWKNQEYHEPSKEGEKKKKLPTTHMTEEFKHALQPTKATIASSIGRSEAHKEASEKDEVSIYREQGWDKSLTKKITISSPVQNHDADLATTSDNPYKNVASKLNYPTVAFVKQKYHSPDGPVDVAPAAAPPPDRKKNATYANVQSRFLAPTKATTAASSSLHKEEPVKKKALPEKLDNSRLFKTTEAMQIQKRDKFVKRADSKDVTQRKSVTPSTNVKPHQKTTKKTGRAVAAEILSDDVLENVNEEEVEIGIHKHVSTGDNNDTHHGLVLEKQVSELSLSEAASSPTRSIDTFSANTSFYSNNLSLSAPINSEFEIAHHDIVDLSTIAETTVAEDTHENHVEDKHLAEEEDELDNKAIEDTSQTASSPTRSIDTFSANTSFYSNNLSLSAPINSEFEITHHDIVDLSMVAETVSAEDDENHADEEIKSTEIADLSNIQLDVSNSLNLTSDVIITPHENEHENENEQESSEVISEENNQEAEVVNETIESQKNDVVDHQEQEEDKQNEQLVIEVLRQEKQGESVEEVAFENERVQNDSEIDQQQEVDADVNEDNNNVDELNEESVPESNPTSDNKISIYEVVEAQEHDNEHEDDDAAADDNQEKEQEDPEVDEEEVDEKEEGEGEEDDEEFATTAERDSFDKFKEDGECF